jgi:uncharacterized membrane protein (UPF0127 family)
MRSNVTAKTKSALKNRSLLLLIAASVMLAALFLVIERPSPAVRTLKAGGHAFRLELAVTDEEHEVGLSGRQELASGKGMLFVFQRETDSCFWMKDMRFPIDIIWTTADREVVFLSQNVRPDSYPRTYCTPEPAAYVIELPAGSIGEMGIRRGQVLNF